MAAIVEKYAEIGQTPPHHSIVKGDTIDFVGGTVSPIKVRGTYYEMKYLEGGVRKCN